jgi:23S rRNA pseudouridine2605 synthase
MDNININNQDQGQPDAIRLQKYLADQGVASRRKAEEMITAGRVAVNGQVVIAMGVKIRPGIDRVHVDGKPVQQAPSLRYILLHKPAGYICSTKDEKGRRTVLDLVGKLDCRIYPVGRLDYDTSGLLLLTNDGLLTNRLLHPSHQVEKTYLVTIEGLVGKDALRKLQSGILLADGITAPATTRIRSSKNNLTLLEITIHEGRNRQVRRMVEAIGHQVVRLKRIRLAFLELKDLRAGEWRELTPAEIKRLKSL